MPSNKVEVDPNQIIRTARDAVQYLKDDRHMAVDLETDGLNPWRNKIAVVSLHGNESGRTAIIHCRGVVPTELIELLSQPRTYIAHNGLGFDEHLLAEVGVDIFAGTWYDTLIGEQVVIQSERKDLRVNLQATVKRRLGVDIAKDVDHGSWMNDVLDAKQELYCAEDVVYLAKLYDAQWERARELGVEAGLQFEVDLHHVVFKMVYNGCPFDVAELESYFEELSKRRAAGEAYLYDLFGRVNLGSWQQVKAAWLAAFGVELPDTTKETFIAIADNGVTEEVRQAAQSLLDYKYANKRITFYDQGWRDLYLINGRAHPRQWPVGARTGRFTSSDPNFQQIPRDMRRVIGGRPGYKIVKGDLSQIEVVTAAYIAKDQALLDACATGDVHRQVAALMFGCEPGDVTEGQRAVAKAGSFTLIFGGGAKTMWLRAKLFGSDASLKDIKEGMNRWLTAMAGIDRMRERAYERARRGGPLVVTFPTGLRRVYITPQERQATTLLNNIVQATAGAGLKYALMRMRQSGVWEYLILTVHDEIVAEVPEDKLDWFVPQFEADMLGGLDDVMPGAPVRVKIDVGERWS